MAEDGRGGESLPHDWDAQYEGTPPWDIGRPQRPFVALADAGGLGDTVHDLGCGTGEHALLAAERGCRASGVDLSARAIEKARTAASTRGLDVDFRVGDALDPATVPEGVDQLLDCGFLHVLGDTDRRRLADLLRTVLPVGGRYVALTFSDAVPGDAGPRRLGRDEFSSIFSDGLVVDAVETAYIEATFIDDLVPAWLAHVRRV